MTATAFRIAFLGFGEAAEAMVRGLRSDGISATFTAYDIKSDGPDAAAMHSRMAANSVAVAEATAAACDNADVIFSLVTADQAETAARSAAATGLDGGLYLDCNSCAPETKRRAGAMIETAGGRYVDVAIMTPIHPKLHKSPCLIAGPHAEPARDVMRDLGMNTKIGGNEIGHASVRKMIRSVMVKGLEALTLECFLAARAAGIDDDVMASLDGSYPGFDWPRRAPYMIERALTHGTRRAMERDEVAKTLSDLGIDPQMVTATVARQRQAGALNLDAGTIGPEDITALTDAILDNVRPQ